MPTALLIYLALISLMSPVTFAVFAWDKHRAKRGGWRVSEKTLHTLELLGGWLGAWCAMRWLRHKSVKRAYRWVFRAIVLLHVAGFGAAWWWFVQ